MYVDGGLQLSPDPRLHVSTCVRQDRNVERFAVCASLPLGGDGCGVGLLFESYKDTDLLSRFRAFYRRAVQRVPEVDYVRRRTKLGHRALHVEDIYERLILCARGSSNIYACWRSMRFRILP